MKYKCLVLDHDDTAVDSSHSIHLPAYNKMLSVLRPDEPPIGPEQWFQMHIGPGLMYHLREELKFSDEEVQIEYEMWQAYGADKSPRFYPGLIDIVKRFEAEGGMVAVVSHNTEETIMRDYRTHADGLIPGIVFGWNHDPEKSKPSPWPMEQIISQYGLEPKDVLMVDDLKPGQDMAHAAGTDFALAAWAHDFDSVWNVLSPGADYILREVAALEVVLFDRYKKSR